MSTPATPPMTSATADEQHEVLVVGGALTGLTTAAFLARYGVDVVVVERHPGVLAHPRLRGLAPRAVEVFRQLELESAIRDASYAEPDRTGDDTDAPAGLAFVPVRADTLAGQHEPVGDVAQGTEDVLEPGRYSPSRVEGIDQDRLEELIRGRARALGADLRYNTELIDLVQDAQGVTVTLRDRATGIQRTLRAAYVVAADGAASPIRGRLGIASDGPGVLASTITALVDADLRPALRGRQIGIAYLQRPQPFTVLMAHDRAGLRWVFGTGYDPATESPGDYGPDRIAAMVRAAAGLPDVEVRLRPQIPGTTLTVLGFDLAARVARAYASDRVFLAGDAARVNPPTGGFGGSTGVQDAHNLAWKLAAVLRGWAGADLLASYDAERRPVGLLTMRQALARFGDRMTGDTQVELLDYAAVTTGYRYRSTAVVAEGADAGVTDPYDGPAPIVAATALRGEPGTRAPHRWLPGTDGRMSTLDLYGQGMVALTGNATRAAEAEKVAVALGVPLTAHVLDGELLAAHGATIDGTVLVRPDGFVAWRDRDGAGKPAAFDAALRRVLAR